MVNTQQGNSSLGNCDQHFILMLYMDYLKFVLT